jgi:hypothetical protein
LDFRMSIVLTTETLAIALDAAPATNQLSFNASYADQGAAAGDNAGLTNGTTAVSLVLPPSAGFPRVINSISVINRDTATRTITIAKVSGSNIYIIVSISLSSGYHLFYDSAGGWRVLDSNGNFLETVQAKQSGTWTVGVNNFPATQPVSGSVAVTNFPATQPVSITGSLPAGTNALGSVTVSNFPSGGGAVSQGTAAPITAPWPVIISNGTNAIGGASSNPIFTTIVGGVSVGGTVNVSVQGSPQVAVSNWGGPSLSVAGPVGVTPTGNVITVNAQVLNPSIPIIYAPTSTISQGVYLTTTTASNILGIITQAKCRGIKIDLVGYSSTSSITLTITAGNGIPFATFLLPPTTSPVTSFNWYFSDLVNLSMTNSGNNVTAQLSASPSAGSVGVHLRTST